MGSRCLDVWERRFCRLIGCMVPSMHAGECMQDACTGHACCPMLEGSMGARLDSRSAAFCAEWEPPPRSPRPPKVEGMHRATCTAPPHFS
eukprot:365023-Chlamydomonas_euryale.AAC.12